MCCLITGVYMQPHNRCKSSTQLLNLITAAMSQHGCHVTAMAELLCLSCSASAALPQLLCLSCSTSAALPQLLCLSCSASAALTHHCSAACWPAFVCADASCAASALVVSALRLALQIWQPSGTTYTYRYGTRVNMFTWNLAQYWIEVNMFSWDLHGSK